jgi:hypothetical protein
MEELNRIRRRRRYDLPTAVTFLVAGLGLGSLLTLLFAPCFEQALRAGARPTAITQPTL